MLPVKEQHSITIHPALWGRLGDIADAHYDGSRSKAIEGLTIYEWMVAITKARSQKKHSHWVSAPLALHPEEMEGVIARLLAGDADYVGDWLQRRIAERAEEIAAKLASNGE